MYAIYGLPFTINIPHMLAYNIYHTTGSVMGMFHCQLATARDSSAVVRIAVCQVRRWAGQGLAGPEETIDR